MKLLLSCLAILMMGATNCTQSLKPDKELSAIEGGDLTAFIQGCDHEPVPGYAVCRKREGDASKDTLTFNVPPQTKCGEKESCVIVRVYFPDGSAPTHTYAFPKGATRWQVPWNQLLHQNTFDKGHRGFWPVLITIYWEDKDGRENVTLQDGEIRLVVFSKDYIPLFHSPHDENFAWEWTHDDQVYRLTTGGRAYTGSLESAVEAQ